MLIEKRSIVVMILLICFIYTVAAVEVSTIGIVSGLNIANTTGKFVDETKPKLGYIGGFFIETKIGTKSFIQSEILINSKGYKIKDKYVDIDAYFAYLEFSLLYKYLYYNINQYNFIALGGPVLGYSFYNDLVTKFYDENINTDSFSINKFDIGVIAGFEIKRKLNSKRDLVFDVRYEHGFISWDENRSGYCNKGICILLGISI